MERSHPTSGRSATPADINRNGRPTSIGTGGRHQSECPADIIGIRSVDISIGGVRAQSRQKHPEIAREYVLSRDRNTASAAVTGTMQIRTRAWCTFVIH